MMLLPGTLTCKFDHDTLTISSFEVPEQFVTGILHPGTEQDYKDQIEVCGKLLHPTHTEVRVVNKNATSDSSPTTSIFQAKSLTLTKHVDYDKGYSLGLDAANRQMQQAGRTAWNKDDASLAAQTLNLHGASGHTPGDLRVLNVQTRRKGRSVDKQFIFSALLLDTRKPTHAGWVFRFTSTKKDCRIRR